MKSLFLAVLFLCSCTTSNKSLKVQPPFVSKQPTIVKIDHLAKKYIVQNLATMTLRVYQIRCDTCPSELIFQAPMVVGKDEVGKRTKVGYYRIYRWVKFHQDYQSQYLPWHHKTPPPNSPRSDWKNIGAFGWYAALLEPNASAQWLHGTIGWSNEGDKFIEPQLNSNNSFIRVKSKGCTRVSNPTVAFLRDFVPEGSWVFRIYAKETSSSEIENFATSWSHSLTYKNEILDQGQWSVTFANEAKVLRNKQEWKPGELNGNPYEVPLDNLRGEFRVDLGKINNYSHPKTLPLGGELKVPEFFTFR